MLYSDISQVSHCRTDDVWLQTKRYLQRISRLLQNVFHKGAQAEFYSVQCLSCWLSLPWGNRSRWLRGAKNRWNPVSAEES